MYVVDLLQCDFYIEVMKNKLENMNRKVGEYIWLKFTKKFVGFKIGLKPTQIRLYISKLQPIIQLQK